MSGKFFIDTNILVYAYDSENPAKKDVSQKLILDGIKEENAVISLQVLNEFFVTITRKVEFCLPPQTAKNEILQLKSMEISPMDFSIVLSAIEIHIKNKLSYWDSLIISSAKKSKCSVIFSEDMHCGQAFNGLKIINPYK